MTIDRNARRLLLGLLLTTALLPACNDEQVTDPGGNTLTDPTGSTVLFTQSFPIGAATDIQHPAIVSFDVVIPASGSVRVEADWTAIENDLDVVVVKDECRNGIAAWNGDCSLLDQDRSSLTKPARVDFTTTGAVNTRIYVYNFSQAETAVVQVLLR